MSAQPKDPSRPDYVARRRRREETRDRILTSSADLFYRRGITTVSMDEAAANAGVTKPTLYAHFSTKELLVAEALNAVEIRHFQWFEERLAEITATGVLPVLAVFDVLDGWFHSPVFRGCAYINASVEIGASNPPAQVAVLRHKGRTRRWLRDLAEQSGVAAQWCETLAGHLMLLMEGAIVTAFVENDDQAAVRAREVAEILLAAQHPTL